MKRSARIWMLWISLAGLAACDQGAQIPEGLQESTDKAVRDLAARENVDAGAVRVQLAEYVTWSDASLGCPRPGQFYAQVITEGYRIVLMTESGEYAYHGATGHDPVLCQY